MGTECEHPSARRDGQRVVTPGGEVLHPTTTVAQAVNFAAGAAVGGLSGAGCGTRGRTSVRWSGAQTCGAGTRGGRPVCGREDAHCAAWGTTMRTPCREAEPVAVQAHLHSPPLQ